MRLLLPLLALPLALPASAQAPSAAVVTMSFPTALASGPTSATMTIAQTQPPQEAPAEPEAPKATPTAESAAQAEPEPERAEPEPEPPRRVVFAPTPKTAIVIRSELPPDQRRHSRGYYQRAAERCLRRATEIARRRCLERVARE